MKIASEDREVQAVVDRRARAERRFWASWQYQLLSRSLGYPTPEGFSKLREAAEAVKGDAEWESPRVRKFRQAYLGELEGLERGDFEGEFLRVFSHVLAADCSPCETAYTARHVFQVSQRLADVTGFYRSFGLEPDAERPDHVAVELEFMAFLAYKEALALWEGGLAQAKIVRRGEKLFLERHLGRWLPTLADLIERKAGRGPMAALGRLLPAVLQEEARYLRARIPRQTTLTLPLASAPGSPPQPVPGPVERRSVFGGPRG
jgi:TorA maturation chaperone TorD